MPVISTKGTYSISTYGGIGGYYTAVVPVSSFTVEYLVVAGGGGGSVVQGGAGCGGGAGGVINGSATLTKNVLYSVIIGQGGAAGPGANGVNGVGGSGGNGTNSSIAGIVSATGGGGGGGGATPSPGLSGGSGGGTFNTASGPAGAGIAGQGFAGGVGTLTALNGSGGGGGSQAGGSASISVNSGQGGNGLTSSITGVSTSYGGGGGGGSSSGTQVSTQIGGSGGGGNGGYWTGAAYVGATPGTANTGGGGGGAGRRAGTANTAAASGGSGLVIIRSPYGASSSTNVASTIVLGNSAVYTFNNDGNITFDLIRVSSLSAYSIKFNGTTDYLSIPANTALNDFSSTPFTLEGWVYFTGSVSAFQVIATTYLNSTTGYILSIENNVFNAQFTGDGIDIQGTTSVALSTWYHVAISGTASSSVKLFVNGVQEGITYTSTIPSANTDLRIGRLNTTSAYMNGYVSNLRVIKGAALYTSNFTPPTAVLEKVPNTVLLTGQSSVINDNSNNNFTVNTGGSPTVSRINPFNV